MLLNFTSNNQTILTAVFIFGVLLSSFASAKQNINPQRNEQNFYTISQSQHGDVDITAIEYIDPLYSNPTQTQVLSEQGVTWKKLTDNFMPNNQLTYWFKVKLRSEKKGQWLLTPGLWHQGKVFYQNKSGHTKDWQVADASVFTPLDQRAIKSELPMVKVEITPKGSTFYIQAKGFRFGREPSAQKIKLFSEIAFMSEQAASQKIQGGYMGFAIAIAGFHFILWLWFRENTYLWLVAAMMGSPIFFHSILGFGLTDLWPNWLIWNEYSSSILSAVAPAIYIRFGASYLNLQTHFAKLNQVIIYLFYAIILSSVAVFIESIDLLAAQAILTNIASLLLLGSALYLAIKGQRYAWYFVAGNFMIILTILIWSVVEISEVRWSDLPFSIIGMTQFASTLQGILLALGMVDRMQTMRHILLKKELESEKLAGRYAKQTRALIQAQNEELESSNKALKELDDLKDEFLARTSHELNTPLNGIIGLSEILLDDDADVSEKERKEYLEIIASRGEHLKELVSELLEFVKTRKEVINLYKEKIDISSHIEKTVLTFVPQAESKAINLQFKKTIPVLVHADPRRLRQVLAILIDNAIKYTDKGGVTLSINKSKSRVTIIVADTGIGIEESQLETILEPFRQLKHENRTREGAGLGLSICNHLVELHGGQLKIESVIGKGSKFSISLPLQ